VPARTIELFVNHHPGIVAQVAGVVFRRGFELEAVDYTLTDRGREGRMVLTVVEHRRFPHLVRDLARLHDVRCVREAASGEVTQVTAREMPDDTGIE